MINILAASRLMTSPRIYSTFLLYLLSELFEQLPEVGDPQKPGLVFFFDEAHLLFTDAPKPFLEKIEQVVRLVRSKGVGVYFVTRESDGHSRPGPRPVREPGAARLAGVFSQRAEGGQGRRRDVPGEPEARCREGDHRARRRGGARLRPGREGDAVRGGARLRPAAPEPATPLSPEERAQAVRDSVLHGHYENAVDRESAYEKLKEKAAQRQAEESAGGAAPAGASKGGRAPEARSETGVLIGAMVKSAAHAIGSQLGRQIIRGVLGSILGGKR